MRSKSKSLVIKALLQSYSSEEEESKEKTLRTSTPYVSYESSAFQDSNLPAAPYCRRVVETKSRKNKIFDPGSSQVFNQATKFHVASSRPRREDFSPVTAYSRLALLERGSESTSKDAAARHPASPARITSPQTNARHDP